MRPIAPDHRRPDHRRARVTGIVLVVLVGGLAAVPGGLAAASGLAAVTAPTRIYAEPPRFLLLRLGGDQAHFHYTPGSLDRAANLQQRLERVARGFERWTDRPIDYTVFVLNRREWEEAGIDVEYGIPVRVGTRGIAVPARGDAGTVDLWAELLDGMLPSVDGTPVLGTPQETASLVVADAMAQLLASQILIETLGLEGDEAWVRGVMAHLAALSAVERLGTDRPEDLAVFYRRLGGLQPAATFSVRDDREGLPLREWLWFQARYHSGARVIYDEEGKDALKKMRKLHKKGKLTASHLRRKQKGLDEWLADEFTAVSRQR